MNPSATIPVTGATGYVGNRLIPTLLEKGCRLVSTFIPRGLAGLIYWHAFYPAHAHVFRGLLAGIAQAAGAAVVSGPDKVDASTRSLE
jgi:nucleoside-diphosphate-sugar epimerase